MNCKDCKYFRRGSWHKSVDPHEREMLGGYCDVLPKVLALTNSSLWSFDELYIQDTFGCTMFNEECKQ